MKDYYKILEVDPSATDQEIKRAYFKLIRKYSPESDVERFQEIREAYEYLKEHRKEYTIPLPEDTFARKMVEQIEQYIKYKQYNQAIESCKEGIRYFPEEFYFQYQLGQCQLYNGNTGNAIKTFQAMVEKYPQEKECIKNLAIAYYERGFYKKAVPVFEQAYQLGCNEIEFIIDYCHSMDVRKDFLKIYEIVLAYLEQKNEIERGQTEEHMELFTILLIVLQKLNHEDDRQEVQRFLTFIKQNREEISKEVEIVSVLLISYIDFCKSINCTLYQDLILQLTSELDNIGLKPELRAQIEWHMLFERLEEDECIHKNTVRYIATFQSDVIEMYPSDMIRFMRIDTELCMMDHMDETLKDADILRVEYPLFYEITKEFFQMLQKTKNLAYQKEKRLKEFRLKKMYYPMSYYEENTMDPMKKEIIEMDTEDEWDQFTPYVRTEKKIGRNDPCPCGSGLKFKKCCGR